MDGRYSTRRLISFLFTYTYMANRISIMLVFVFFGLLSWFALEDFEIRAYITLIPILFAIQISLNDALELHILKRFKGTFFNILIAPGTIAHELSHLIAATLTGCQINRINLFRLNSKTRTLGYVEYAQRRDEFELFRNILIGFAPFFGCGMFLILLLNLSSSITGEDLLAVGDSVFTIPERFLSQFHYLDSYPALFLIIYLQLCLGFGSAPSTLNDERYFLPAVLYNHSSY